MNKRGYFAIGIYNPLKEVNIGTLWRSAHNFGAAFIFIIGRKYKLQKSDTTKAYLSVPLYEYADFNEFYKNLPKDCRLTGIEIDARATPIKNFVHGDRTIYLLGSEKRGLPPEVIDQCNNIVQLPGKFCNNVAVCGSIVMFDRINKIK